MKSKYHNIRTEVDGVKFASKKEAKRYGELKMLQKAGEVKWFICQPRFDLPGGIKYYADFLVVWAAKREAILLFGEAVTVEDVKGMKTRVYTMKKKLVEATYPIKREEK